MTRLADRVGRGHRPGFSHALDVNAPGSAERALLAQRRLRAAGFWVVAIRPPTVPEGGARLRVTLSAAHTEEQIDALIAALARALEPEHAA